MIVFQAEHNILMHSSSSSLAGEDGFVVLFPTESDLSGNFSFACF
jgi:hypothetical protein